ncbi:hypothetical protein [Leucothrix arctica]|uniref:Uncharacterized protein n=1 Tax=Leucothrix arctica TaxID=1481894 RepID=A0A317C3K9_9GAMM|nr:hypothetical protein [Leucothrix arctica]PWQ93168.1 hypothetical protein DKT75_20995 [Leucothrix arctica]
MKVNTPSIFNLIVVAATMVIAPNFANAAITTQFCLLNSNTQGGTDSTSIYVNLTGVSGSTGQLNLDNPGNDFIPKQWSCYEFSLADLAGNAGNAGEDIGAHQQVEIAFVSTGMNNFCITEMYSRRLEHWDEEKEMGSVLSTSRFGTGNEEICYGSSDIVTISFSDVEYL